MRVFEEFVWILAISKKYAHLLKEYTFDLMRIKSHKTLYTYRLIVSGVKFVIVIPIKLAPCRMRMRIELALVYLMTLRLIKIIELLLFLMMTQSDYRANGLQFFWPTFRPSNRLRIKYIIQQARKKTAPRVRYSVGAISTERDYEWNLAPFFGITLSNKPRDRR